MVVAGEIDDDWLDSQHFQLKGAGVAMLQVGKPSPPGGAAELRMSRCEAAPNRAKS